MKLDTGFPAESRDLQQLFVGICLASQDTVRDLNEDHCWTLVTRKFSHCLKLIYRWELRGFSP